MTMFIVGYLVGWGRKLRLATWMYLGTAMVFAGLAMVPGTPDANANYDNFCGDGTLAVNLGEECDDGNYLNGDGCNHNCQLETAVQSETATYITDTETGSPAIDTTKENKPKIDKNKILESNPTSPILKTLQKLIKASYKPMYTSLATYFGNNKIFYQVMYTILEEYSYPKQYTVIKNLSEKLESMDNIVLRKKYNLHKDGLLDMMGNLLETKPSITRGSKTIISHGELLQYSLPRSSQPITYQPIVFTVPNYRNISSIDWRFGAGMYYACERSICSPKPVVYTREGTYPVSVHVVYEDGSQAQESSLITINYGEKPSRQTGVKRTYRTTNKSNVYRPSENKLLLDSIQLLIEENGIQITAKPISTTFGPSHAMLFELKTEAEVTSAKWEFGNDDYYTCNQKAQCNRVMATYQEAGDYVGEVSVYHTSGKVKTYRFMIEVQ